MEPADDTSDASNERKRRRRRRGRKPKHYERSVAGVREAARQRFGIDRLHPEQEQAIEGVVAGQDTVVVLPTGFGKSLIYQAPALTSTRPTIVISPLIALMADQQHALARRGIPVIRIDSSLKAAERRAALERLERGGQLIVLTTPETLESPKTRPQFVAAQPWLLCIDEAHCISEWGHDFRPAYLRLGAQRKHLGGPPILALTATATPKVRDDIAARLGMQQPRVITAPPHRENLELGAEVLPGNLKPERAGKLIRRLQRPGIVYCSTTVEADKIWVALNRGRVPTARYHGKMKAAERAAAQRRYMKPSKRIVMVATSAFGMGIDKPNIRYILHYQAPGSLEQYVQEAGRAGRDGKPSSCILLFDPADLEIQKHLQQKSRASSRQLRRVAEALAAWAADGRPVSASELALSAQVPQTNCRSLCAQLENLGLVALDEDGRYAVGVSTEALREAAEDLAGRLEILRRQDKKRLEAMEAYATTEECRSRFIRRYFGEDDPPVCGRCDRCRATRQTDQSTRALERATAAGFRGEPAEAEIPRPRRRRRGARGQPATGEQRGSRRRRRGRGRNKGKSTDASADQTARSARTAGGGKQRPKNRKRRNREHAKPRKATAKPSTPSEQQTAESKASKPKAGKKQAGKQTASKPKAGKKQAGKKQAGKKQAGKKRAGKQQAGKQKAGKQKAGKQKAGKQKAGKQKAGKKQAGKKHASKKTASKQTASKPKAGKKQASKKYAGKRQAGKKKARKKQAGKRRTVGRKKTTR